MITCPRCGPKPDSEFYTKFASSCKTCAIQRSRDKYAPVKQALKDERQSTYKGDKKRCKVCGVFKDTSDYTVNKYHWDNLSHECRACEANRGKRTYQKNKTKRLAVSRLWYKNNKRKKQAKAHEWQINNRDKSRAIWHRYNSRKKAAEGSFNDAQWTALRKFYCPNRRCLACRKVSRMTVDHVVPLIKGGSNYIENIQPLCAKCNSGKGDKHVEYRPDNGVFAKSLMST